MVFNATLSILVSLMLVFPNACFSVDTSRMLSQVSNGVEISQVENDVVEIDVELSRVLDSWDSTDDGSYYYNQTGLPKTGWFENGNDTLFLDVNGQSHTGWLDIDGNRYYFDQSGALSTGLVNINSKTFFFDETGVMQTGFVFFNTDNVTRYFDTIGSMRMGWLHTNDSNYYFDENGIMRIGWYEIEDRWYYFKEDGTMAVGWLDIDGKTYYFDKLGVFCTGWHNIDDAFYYFDANGVKQVGETYVASDDATYYLYDAGGYATNTSVDGLYYDSDGHRLSEYYDADRYVHNGSVTTLDNEYNGYGRLYIPDVGINVGLYQVGYYDDVDAQALTDAADSAVYMVGWGVTPFIGDHTNQGFSGIRNCTNGTKAFIRTGGNTYVYSCYSVGGGTNDGYSVYDGNGTLIWNHNATDIALYTCNGNWQNVSIVVFQLIDVL